MTEATTLLAQPWLKALDKRCSGFAWSMGRADNHVRSDVTLERLWSSARRRLSVYARISYDGMGFATRSGQALPPT
jgi:hypothetical protein